MTNRYQPLIVQQKSTVPPIALSKEATYWSSLKTLVNETLPHPVSDVCFSPVSPFNLAVCSGNSVSLLSLLNSESHKTFSRFRDITYSPHFKRDGRLLVAGTAHGEASVYDIKSRSELRKLVGHKGAVRSARFSTDGLHVMTGSDDSTVRTWDLAEGRCLFSLRDAKDYVRAQAGSPTSLHVWAAGSYDRKARLYDLRSQKCIFTFDHGHQVNDIQFYPGGARIITVGGSEVKLWDLFTGGQLVQSISCHAKSVTSASVDADHEQIFTAGLDGYVKVHDFSLQRTRGVMLFGSQIVSLDITADGNRYAVGTADGSVEVRACIKGATIRPNAVDMDDPDKAFEGWGRGFERESKGELPTQSGKRPRYFRGANVRPSGDDFVVKSLNTGKLKKLDMLLKNFSHTEALELAIQWSNMDSILAVVDELKNRNNLVQVISNLDLSSLEMVFGLLKKSVLSPRYSMKAIFLLNVLLDIHANDIPKHSVIFTNLSALLTNVRREVNLKKKMAEMEGTVEMMLAVPRSLA